MENASKALIIAGAILISILLISVGVMIMGSTDGLQDQMTSSMTEQEIQAFNTKFLSYEGTKVRGSKVKTLIDAIETSNTVNEVSNAQEAKFVAIEFRAAADSEKIETISGARSTLGVSKTYKVECEKNTTTGLVNKVKITGVSI